jgi:peptidoglycan/xylan/chitin deacetylase (PgdA/CDA1 family)
MKIVYPGGKTKALTFSYDDNQIYDRRLLKTLNEYGLQGTFHINSGTVGWKDESVEFVQWEELKELYQGHEVACHGLNHPFFGQLPQGQLLYEIQEDKKRLEHAVNYVVRGMSYPFGEYSDTVIETAGTAGIEYSRTVEATGNFFWPVNFMRWHPTCHHDEAIRNKDLVNNFLNPPGYLNLPLFYIWGHSFEFARNNNWEDFEKVCAALAGHKDVWYATNIQIKDYISAVRGLVYSADQTMIYNPSAITVYFMDKGSLITLEPRATLNV